MPWRQVGTRRYFYHSVRVNGRPVGRYMGTGPAGELAAASYGLKRLARAVEVRECQLEQDGFQDAKASLLALCQGTDVLASAALVAAGFHRPNRGIWRRRHERIRKN